jgi:hypothetical protein
MTRREEHKERVDQGEPFRFLIHPPVLIPCQKNILMKKYFNEKYFNENILMKKYYFNEI